MKGIAQSVKAKKRAPGVQSKMWVRISLIEGKAPDIPGLTERSGVR